MRALGFAKPVPKGAGISPPVWNERPMVEPAEERRLLASLAGGDARALDALVAATYERVYASLYRMCGGDADRAADLTQETYRKAWRALGGFDARAQFSTWLYRIAYTTFLNDIRRPARVQPMAEGLDPVDPAPGVEETLTRAQDGERLRRAVVALPEELRFTVTARFWGELPVAEIARLENVTGAAIRKRLDKATRLLREALAEDAR